MKNARTTRQAADRAYMSNRRVTLAEHDAQTAWAASEWVVKVSTIQHEPAGYALAESLAAFVVRSFQ
jgi:flagellar basal body rod protein FlgC